MMILLLGEKSFLVDEKQKKFTCQYGEIDLTKAKVGSTLKSNTGEVFIVVKPTFIDMLKKCRRMPQIITPKDAAQIVAVTGVNSGWKCLDAGGGSGFLTIFLANIVGEKGSVFTYEKNTKFYENIKKNLEFCNLKNVTLKNKPAEKFTEKDFDLVTLDMMGAEKMVDKVFKALKPGAWFVIYSPHVEQQKAVLEKINKKSFIQVHTVENIQRSWQVSDYTHPKPSGIMHTGFLTFARKLN